MTEFGRFVARILRTSDCLIQQSETACGSGRALASLPAAATNARARPLPQAVSDLNFSVRGIT